MTKKYGAQNMVAPLKKVIVRAPNTAFANADPEKWHYLSKPNIEIAKKEHTDFVSILESYGCQVVFHGAHNDELADSIYVHDPLLIVDEGAILLKMGKALRAEEPELIKDTLLKNDIPIHAELSGDALAEGGDLLWLDEKTLAAGIGFRTNREGVRQLQMALPNVEIVPVELPYYLGPDACLHLMSTISMIDKDLAIVYKPLTSVPFLQRLEKMGIELIEVPESEFESMGPNILAMGPRQCLMLAGNPITQSRLLAAGCEIVTYQGNEISLIAEGGATCLTRPILRSYD